MIDYNKYSNHKRDDSFRVVNPPITNENIKELFYKIRCPSCKKISDARFQIYEGDVLRCVLCNAYLQIKKIEQINKMEWGCEGVILNPNSQYIKDIQAGKYRHQRIDKNTYY